MAKEWTVEERMQLSTRGTWVWVYIPMMWALSAQGSPDKYGFMSRDEAEAMAKLLNASRVEV